MPNLQQLSPAYNKYIPAVLRHNSEGWQVNYYVYNPITDKMERKRMLLNTLRKRYRTIAEFKVAANEIISTINAKLAGGWTPFGESENARYYTTIDEMIKLYLSEKSKELKPDTMRSYRSFCNIFSNWCADSAPNCKCIQFNKTLAVQYMDYIYMEREVAARAYNNQLKMARALFSWALQKCYCKENPFEHIKTKRQDEKKRIIIPPNTRQKIKDYLLEKNPVFLIILELVFTSLLRPAEIARIQIKQIHLKEQYIFMPADKTKNGHNRHAFLSKELVMMIAPLLNNTADDWYLIGADFRPGKSPMPVTKYTKTWDKMRKALHLPDEMQLYSLRDTGINNMLKSGIDPLTVMQAADHHDLAMTTRYANHADPNLIQTLEEHAPKF